jgi:hypothetical protein
MTGTTGERTARAAEQIAWQRRTAAALATILACRLTCAFALCLEGALPSGCLSHVMAGCRAAVLRAWRAAGTWFAGFGCTG